MAAEDRPHSGSGSGRGSASFAARPGSSCSGHDQAGPADEGIHGDSRLLCHSNPAQTLVQAIYRLIVTGAETESPDWGPVTFGNPLP